jgi:N-formylglutamate amidohydrolase
MRGITVRLLAVVLVAGALAPGAHGAPAGQTGPATGSPGLSGSWNSDWGPVSLRHSSIEGRAPVQVVGEWQQPPGAGACPAQQGPPGCVGRIEQGRYDPATGVLEFTYYQDWNDTRGTARLTLAPDGAALSGTWTQPGEQGTWTLQRQPIASGRPAAGPTSGADAALSSDLVFAQRGGLPIILTAAHGGDAQVPGVPQRTSGTRDQDARTRELTEAVLSRLEAMFCERPYGVIAYFHRRYIDANRPEAEAYEHPDGRQPYLAYHQSIRGFVNEVRERYPRGAILIDIHGQSEDPGRIHRGTRNGSSVGQLLARSGEDALVGRNSLFGQLQAAGYDVFPANPAPRDAREDPRWNGGYIVDTYGSHRPDGVDVIQLEIGRNFRGDNTLAAMAENLANAIATFHTAYVGQHPRCS